LSKVGCFKYRRYNRFFDSRTEISKLPELRERERERLTERLIVGIRTDIL